MYEVVIVGGGGFGREVYTWLSDQTCRTRSVGGAPARIKGFLSKNRHDLDGFGLDVGVLGSDDDYEVQENDRFVIAVGTIEFKKRMTATLKRRGATFIGVVHPTAVVAESAKLGEGVVLCPFTVVSANVTVGDFVTLNTFASCGHDARVGRYSVLSPYATVNGFTILEEDVFLGTHATVVAGRRVGRGAKVSANSVAMSDTPPGALVQGVPGRSWSIFHPQEADPPGSPADPAPAGRPPTGGARHRAPTRGGERPRRGEDVVRRG